MAESKESSKQSFSEMLRGGTGTSPGGSDPRFQSQPPRTELPKKEEKRKRPILLPFAQKEGEGSLLSVTYKEWAFLMGALLLLFGGMGLIRMFGPKESATPNVAPFSDGLTQEDVTEGLRPAGAGDQEVVSPLSSQDTTRLVQPPPGYGASDKKEKPKGHLDNLKDSLWGGLKEAERRTPPRPSLGGLGPSLAGALAGLNGGPPSQGGRTMSPDEIAARISSIPRNPRGGKEGQRLGYSGAQRVPGIGGGRRSMAESSSGPYGKMREAYEGPKGPDSAAARAGEAFGENRAGGGSTGDQHGAGVEGDTPKGSPDKTELGNYNIQRPPWAMREWELAHRNSIAMEKGVYAFAEGIGGGLGKGIGDGAGKVVNGVLDAAGNFIKCGTMDDSGCQDPPPPNRRQEWVVRTCPSAVPEGKYKVAELVLDYGNVPQPAPPAPPVGKVMVVTQGVTEEVTSDGKGGTQKTQKPDTQTRQCNKGADPVLLTQDDLYAIRATGKTKGELLTLAGAKAGQSPRAPVASASGVPAVSPAPGLTGGAPSSGSGISPGTPAAESPREEVAPVGGLGSDATVAPAPSDSGTGEKVPDRGN